MSVGNGLFSVNSINIIVVKKKKHEGKLGDMSSVITVPADGLEIV